MKKMMMAAIVALHLAVVGSSGCRQAPDKPNGGSPASTKPVATREETPDAVIARAFEAHGGKANFPKAARGHVVTQVSGEFQPGLKGEFRVDEVFDLPGRLQRVAVGGNAEEQVQLVYICEGRDCYSRMPDGRVTRTVMPKPVDTIYSLGALRGLEILRDSGAQLSLSHETGEDGRRLTIIHGQRDGQWIGDAIFDSDTGLCAGGVRQTYLYPPGTQPVQTKLDIRYGEYKEFKGLHIPMTIRALSNGKPYVETRVIRLELLDSVDALLAGPHAPTTEPAGHLP